MHNNTYNKQQENDLPDMCTLLSSLVRLMSCYVREPSVSHAMTLVHLMQQIEKHPGLATNPVAEIAVKQAQSIWREELMQARARCAFESSYFDNKNGNIH